jgi:hypothetical protein
VYARAQSSMHAEDFVVYDDRQSKKVEHVCEVVPDVCIAIFAITFGVEPVGLCNTARFVVATDKMDTLGIAKLEADEERDGFDGEKAAINVVTCEVVSYLCIGGPTISCRPCSGFMLRTLLPYLERDNWYLDKILRS